MNAAQHYIYKSKQKSSYTGEYFTKKSIFCQGPRQQLSFFAEEIFGIFKLKLPYFWTICDKNA